MPAGTIPANSRAASGGGGCGASIGEVGIEEAGNAH